MKRVKEKVLGEALSALADLYPFGELQASTDPTKFIQNVVEEVTLLRSVATAASSFLKELSKPYGNRAAAQDVLQEAIRLHYDKVGGGSR